MTNSSNTLYNRKDLIKQAKKDVKYGFALHPITYAFFMLFSLVVDYRSIAPFQDLVLRMNETTAKYLSAAFIFCIDVVVPIALTKLVKLHFNQKKLNLAMIIAVFLSLGIPLIISIVQKMLGTDIMMPDRGTTAVITQDVKFVTQLLFSLVPLATTVGLTIIGLLRENVKIYRKFRYLQLAIARVTAEKDHITEALQSDEDTLKKRDDSKFVSAITQIFAMRDTLFTRAREMLAESSSTPEATEQVMNSKPVYRTSAHHAYISRYISCNPAIRVVFEDENPEQSVKIMSNPSMSIQNKEEPYYESKEAV